MDARNLWRPTSRRLMRSRGMLLQPPPRPATDARLTRFTTLLDTLTEGERVLDAAHRFVENADPALAESELTGFISAAQPVLEHSEDLPDEYVDLVGQVFARCLVARAAARVERALSAEPAAHILLEAARADAAAAGQLPPEWLDQKTQFALARVQHVVEPTVA